MSETSPLPSVTITLTRYAEPDALLETTIAALARQTGVTGRILFFDQAPNPSFTQRLMAIPAVRESRLALDIIPLEARSLSYARNAAIRYADTDAILYCDADAVPETDWARHLAETLSDPRVAIAGCRILPAWPKDERPIWLSRSRLVREQYSLLDLGTERRPARKVVGAGFGIDRRKLGKDAYFDEQLGRRNGNLSGGEETDLCSRARNSGWDIVYDGRAVTHHQIPHARNTLRWIARRFYAQGTDRARQKGLPQASHRLALADLLWASPLLVVYALAYARTRFAGSGFTRLKRPRPTFS